MRFIAELYDRDSSETLAKLMREHADILRQRVEESHKVHPEFCTPILYADLQRQFRDLATSYADDLSRNADNIMQISGAACPK